MGELVEISDELVEDARAAVRVLIRSIAGQIEFWAKLGKLIEPLLQNNRVLAMQMNGGDRPLSQLLAEVEINTRFNKGSSGQSEESQT